MIKLLLPVLIVLTVCNTSLNAQTKKNIFMTKDIQVSLVPGVSSNGLNSAQYFNKMSLNLLAGISAGNRIIEIGVISNASTFRVTGIQFASIANVVGTNAFIVEPDDKLREHDEEKFTANFDGLQFAGFINYVNENTTGLQFSGLFNATRKSLKGIQVGGFGNTSGGPTQGLQLAGIYNLSGETMSGLQISLLLNSTRGTFSGTQLGIINKARSTGGKNTLPHTRARGLQFGLVNLNRQMDGLQVGVINFGGKARGVQFGLVNFYNRYPSKENVNQGIPIGLLNFGSRGPRIRMYNSEMFPATIEYSSGQCRNCSSAMSEMPFEGKNQVYYHNSMILGSNPSKDLWAFGYGFQRLMYNRVTTMPSPENKKRVMAYGVRFRYLYHSDSANAFNLLSTLNFDYGKRYGGFYIYVSVTANHFLFSDNRFEGLPGWAASVNNNETGKNSQAVWPGYGIGVLF